MKRDCLPYLAFLYHLMGLRDLRQHKTMMERTRPSGDSYKQALNIRDDVLVVCAVDCSASLLFILFAVSSEQLL